MTMAYFEKIDFPEINRTSYHIIDDYGNKALLTAEQARVLLAWLDHYHDEMFQTVHPKVKQGVEELKTIKRCDYCHKEVDQLYNLTPAGMAKLATVRLCKECRNRVVHELGQGRDDLDL
jgi:hypothetical protein